MFLTFIIITKISKLTKKGKERIYFSTSKSKYFALKKEELLIRSILKFLFYETNERLHIQRTFTNNKLFMELSQSNSINLFHVLLKVFSSL